MSVDISGQWWKGSQKEDIAQYLRKFSQDGYPVRKVVITRCIHCNEDHYVVEYDQEQGAARVICSSCSTIYYLADSKDYWNDVAPEEYVCIGCGCKSANVGVGLAYRKTGDIKWLYIGVRCPKCGILGSVADWEIDYGPTADLEHQICQLGQMPYRKSFFQKLFGKTH